MPKFYQTKQFKKLEAEWKQRLKKDGFDDHEDDRGNLRTYDRRTIAFDNRERRETYFTNVGKYLEEHPDLPVKQKRILQLYAKGVKTGQIVKQTKIATGHVDWTLWYHKKKILETL